MSKILSAKPELAEVVVTNGFCDHPDDRVHYPERSLDVIASNLLVNCLYDPLAAFENWFCWLKPGGAVIVMDGLFLPSGWTGIWSEAVDMLPLSVCQSTATVPYLMEKCGYNVRHVGLMSAVNARPSTRTRRYLVIAKKPD